MGENYIGTLIQNVQLHQMVTRDDLIALYYHAGYSVNEIIGFLACHHSSAISERQVHRILRRMNIQRRNNESLLEDIVRAIILELNGSGGNVGYRNMKRRLLTNHGLLATAETVRLALVVLDAEGVLARSRHVLRRRHYISKGPNFSIHIDGWDKLKPYGISIHAGIDGYSRRILWLRACSSNKKPEYIAHFYLKYVREINGVPSIIYGDRGTENAIVRDIQYALRWYHRDPFQGLSSFIYGSSTRNTRIERFWRNLRSMCGQYWMDVFKEMADHGILDTSDTFILSALDFVLCPSSTEILMILFSNGMNTELDEAKTRMNLLANLMSYISNQRSLQQGISDWSCLETLIILKGNSALLHLRMEFQMNSRNLQVPSYKNTDFSSHREQRMTPWNCSATSSMLLTRFKFSAFFNGKIKKNILLIANTYFSVN